MPHGKRSSANRAAILALVAGLITGACGGNDDAEAVAAPWETQWGSAAADTSFGVAAAPNGDLVVAAATEGSLAGDHAGNRDIVVARYRSDGTELWSIQVGGPATDSPLGLSVAPDGSIYVGGFTEGDFAGTNAGSADVWIARFDADGTELWRRQFGGDAWDRGFDVSAFDGGAYITGYSASVLDEATDLEGFDGFAARFDQDGALEWVRHIGTNATDWGQGSSLAPDDGLYITGYTEGDMDGANAGGKDGFVVRLDASGQAVWTRQFGTPGLDWPQGVGTTTDGGVLLAGSTEGDLGGANAGARDAFIAGFDADGTPRFTTQLGTAGVDSVFEVRATPDGIVATGSTEGDLAGSNGDRDGMLVWLDADGTLVAIDQVGSAGVDDLSGLDVSSAGDTYYGGGTFGDVAGTNAGESDIIFGVRTGPNNG